MKMSSGQVVTKQQKASKLIALVDCDLISSSCGYFYSTAGIKIQ